MTSRSNPNQHQALSHWHTAIVYAVVVVMLAACSAPGASTATDDGVTTTGSPPSTGDSSGSTVTSEPDVPPIATGLPSDEVTLSVVHDIDPYYEALFAEFEAQHPNVTVEERAETFADLMTILPRVAATDDPPDILRLPGTGTLVRDGLLRNLDDYSEAYGWNEFTSSLMEQMRVSEDGVERGSGSLYQMMAGGWSITGVFYNKVLAEQVGMTEPPSTLDEFEAILARAVDAGITPIQQDGASYTFPYQALLHRLAEIDDVKAWLYRSPDATIVTPGALQAAETLQRWGESGYFQSDLFQDSTAALSNFQGGDGLFFFSGDWMNAVLEESMGEDVGFFRFPPLAEGGPQYDMGAPFTYGIPAAVENADVAAYFIDWVSTNERARNIWFERFGNTPTAPPGAALPEGTPGTLTAEVLAEASAAERSDELVDFIANATSGIFVTTLIPELQRLVGGETTPEAFLDKVQSDYDAELGR